MQKQLTWRSKEYTDPWGQMRSWISYILVMVTRAFLFYPLLILLLLAGRPFGYSQTIEERLAEGRERFDSMVTNINRETEAESTALRMKYADLLLQMRQQAQAKGELDDVLEVDQEIKRMREDGNVVPINNTTLASLQKMYLEKSEPIAAAGKKKIETLAAQYQASLERLKVELTRGNQIDAALKVRAEIERATTMIQPEKFVEVAEAPDLPVIKEGQDITEAEVLAYQQKLLAANPESTPFKYHLEEGRLRSINLRKHVKDISSLAGMPVSELNLTDTEVSDLSVLKSMPHVQVLHLGDIPVRDLSVLAGRRLRSLTLGQAGQFDDESLAKMSGLETLVLSSMLEEEGFDLRRLRSVPVRNLAFSRWEFEKAPSILAQMTGLQKVSFMRCNKLKDISSLTPLQLNRCHISGPVANLKPLIGQPLESLTLEHSPLDDTYVTRLVEHLPDLRNIGLLDCRNIKDTKAIYQIVKERNRPPKGKWVERKREETRKDRSRLDRENDREN